MRLKSYRLFSLLFAGAIVLQTGFANALTLSINSCSAAETATSAAPELAQTPDGAAPPADGDLYPTEFPVPEPDYSAKRSRDFSPFEAALATLTDARRAALDDLLLEATVPQMQTLMASGTLTAEDLVVYYVDRIRRYELNQLNSVLSLNPNALEIARNLDAERAAGNQWGAMHGIPVLLKDNIATADPIPTTAGAYAMKDWQADRDAQLVKNLRNSGAVILGKANLSEWANYLDADMPSGFSALGGQTRNPYGPFDPMGSSSGSAVSVAANLTAISVGSETQGSLVQPAQANGVVGLKPSRGLVSGDYVIPLADWTDTPGPMGRTVTDVATLLSAMTHTDEGAEESPDPDVAALQGTDFTQFLSVEAAQQRRVGVAIYDGAFVERVVEQTITGVLESMRSQGQPEPSAEEMAGARAAFTQQVEQQLDVEANNQQLTASFSALQAQGVDVVEVNFSAIPQDRLPPEALEYTYQHDLNRFLSQTPGVPVTSLAEIIAINNADPDNRVPYGQDHIVQSENTEITADQFAALQEQVDTAALAKFTQLFDSANIDVLMVPVATTFAHSVTGWPAIAVPDGLADDGKPQSIKLIGRYLGEPDILAVGYAFEQATQGRKAPNLEATLATFANLN
ncbi:MAG: amidase family protein [Cyanobacteria bacterium P01_A01_bin.135]